MRGVNHSPSGRGRVGLVLVPDLTIKGDGLPAHLGWKPSPRKRQAFVPIGLEAHPNEAGPASLDNEVRPASLAHVRADSLARDRLGWQPRPRFLLG